MRERQARYTGICPVRARIYMLIFDDLVAGIKRDAAKRANMLRRVHAEAQMSIDAYRTVFERSIVFGGRKLTQAVETKGNLEGVISTLTSEIDGLKKDVNDPKNVCESLEHRAEKKEKLYEVGAPVAHLSIPAHPAETVHLLHCIPWARCRAHNVGLSYPVPLSPGQGQRDHRSHGGNTATAGSPQGAALLQAG